MKWAREQMLYKMLVNIVDQEMARYRETGGMNWTPQILSICQVWTVTLGTYLNLTVHKIASLWFSLSAVSM